MPNWKKVIISGSNATLNNLDVSTDITASGNVKVAGDVAGNVFRVNQRIAVNDQSGAMTFGFDNTYPIQLGKSTNPITLKGDVTASSNVSASGEVSAKFLELPFSSDSSGASLYFNNGTFAPNDDVPYIRGERQSATIGYVALGYNDSDLLTVGKNSNGNAVQVGGSLRVITELTASNTQINGSLIVTGSGTVLEVQGSAGTLFSVDNDLSGTLFSANDVSGLPVLQASASGDVFIGKTPQSLYTTATISSTIGSTTTESICSLSTSSYDGAFFEYTAREVGNTNSRAGSIMAVWNGANISFTDTSTRDIGSTSLLIIKPIISGSTARLVVYGDSGFKVKTIIKAI